MSEKYDGNDGWKMGPDGEIESGSNQNQPYYPSKEDRDTEIPHDMYGDEDPSDDIDLFSEDVEDESYIDELDEDDSNVIGINDIKGTSSARRAAKPRHPSAWRGRVVDGAFDTSKPDYHEDAPKPVSPDQKEITRRGIAASRKVLDDVKQTNVIPLKPRQPKRK